MFRNREQQNNSEYIPLINAFEVKVERLKRELEAAHATIKELQNKKEDISLSTEAGLVALEQEIDKIYAASTRKINHELAEKFLNALKEASTRHNNQKETSTDNHTPNTA